MTTSNTKLSRETATHSDVSAWYLNGSLSEDDARWARDFLEASEQGREELQFDQGIEHELRAEMAEIPANLGWETLLGKVRADSASTRHSTQPAVAPSTRSRFGGLLDKLFSPAMGMAMAAIVAVQAVTIATLYPGATGEDTVNYRSPATVQQVPAIRAIFAKEMTEARMREVLVESNLRIVDGPTPYGEYVLYSHDGDLEAVAEELKSQGVLAHYSLDQILSPAQ